MEDSVKTVKKTTHYKGDSYNFPAKNGRNNRMSVKMLKFVEEYLVDGNASAAARRAGYSVRTAGGMGIENLNKPVIREAIKKRQEELQKSTQVDQEWVLKRYKMLANYCVSDFFNNDGSLKPLDQIPKEALYAIGSFKQNRRVTGEGDKKLTVNQITNIDLPSKKDVLDSLAKHLGMFEKDNAQKRSLIPIMINVTLED